MEIKELKNKLKADPRNEKYTKRKIEPIFQVSTEARILIIGQAPGQKTHEAGVVFKDKSGDKSRDWLGIDEKTFYSEKIAVLPMDFYFPGKGKSGDLAPRSFIADDYHKDFLEKMPDIELTILAGSYAINYYLKDTKRKNLTETVRNYKDYLPNYFPIVHPSPSTSAGMAKTPGSKKTLCLS